MDYSRQRSRPIYNRDTTGLLTRRRSRDFVWNHILQYSQSSDSVEPFASYGAESISDVLPGPGVSFGDNQCRHTRTDSVAIPYSIRLSDLAGGWGWDAVSTVGQFRRNIPPISTSIDSLQWGNLVSDLFASLDPKGPTALSLFANLWELEQTLDIFKSLQRLIKSGWRSHVWGKQYSRPLGSSKFWNPKALGTKDLIDGAANNWLAYRYGIKPLVSDIIALANMCESIQNRVIYLLEHRQITDTVRFRSKTESPYSLNAAGPGPVTLSYRECVTQVVGCQACWPNFVVSDDFVQSSVYRYMGLDNILSNIWEVLPFSFVLDWFVDVGGAISRARENIARDNADKSVEIFKPWHSMKVEQFFTSATFPRNLDDCWGGWYPLYGESPVPIISASNCSGYQRVYERVPSMPSDAYTPELLQGLSVTHLVDGGAILYQFVK